MKKKLLLVGFDAADWNIINPLLEKGLLPNIQRMINGGIAGKLSTLDPPLSPMLWTSIATGKRPYKHGIIGFTEADENNIITPVTTSGRKCKAVWNILSEQGLKTHVVGWWPSFPAEKINGVCASEVFLKNHFSSETDPEEALFCAPPNLAEKLKSLRVPYSAVKPEHLMRFVPEAHLLPDDKRKPLEAIGRIFAENMSVHNNAVYLLEHTDWDFCAVYYDAIDHFKHGFMQYFPPKQPHIEDELFRFYKNVVVEAYRFMDFLLGDLLKHCPNGTRVMIVSDHGYKTGNDLPEHFPLEPAGPAAEHDTYGVFIFNTIGQTAANRDFQPVLGASVLDITPCILQLFDLPIGKDMDGRVLNELLKNEQHVAFIPTYESDIQKEFFKKTKINTQYERESLERLAQLGYIEMPDEENADVSGKKVILENAFYLARSYMHGGLYQEALPILENIFKETPDQIRYGIRLVNCLMVLGYFEEAETILKTLKVPENSLAPLAFNLLLAQGKPNDALRLLESLPFKPTDYQTRMGKCFMAMNQWQEAENIFEKQTDNSPNDFEAWFGLGTAQLRLGKSEEALESLLSAAELRFDVAVLHYHIGEAFYRLEEFPEAAQSYQLALYYNPAFQRARLQLIDIFEHKLNDTTSAERYKTEILESEKSTIYIVSGLPRSGTSMMMAILESAGIKAFTDQQRLADEHNPNGYFEHQAVLNLTANTHFLAAATNKSVKVIAHLLPSLPPRYRYKIVFMQREISEMLTSQQKMAGISTENINFSLAERYQQDLDSIEKWMSRSKSFAEVLYISYRDCHQNPAAVADHLSTFLAIPVSKEIVEKVVKPELWRNRKC